MIIWGDHTWHGSYEKASPGLRMMVLGMFNRPHMVGAVFSTMMVSVREMSMSRFRKRNEMIKATVAYPSLLIGDAAE